MKEEIFSIRGTWSEVSLLIETRLEAGKKSFQAWMIKTLSRRIRVGEALPLDQVS
jgi:hypothetical protein